jgi:2-oxoisovalerate dehydrogenase E1 component
MFADFVTLAMDQIFNHAVKFPGMFPGIKVPLLIRTPSGGRRGYGPTHSQSPESLLAAVPGLTVVFASHRHDPGEILKRAVLNWPYPTVAMEHKLLYGRTVDRGDYQTVPASAEDPAAGLFPTLISGSNDPDVTIVCYGDAVHLAEGLAARLRDEDIEVEIVAPSLIAPLPKATLTALLLSRPRVVTLEETPQGSGFGSELGATLLEAGFRGRFLRLAPPPVPIPAARSLEATVLPDENSAFDSAVQFLLREIVTEKA